MLISERIYKYLDEKGISQNEFAKRTGISQSTVSDWKRKGTNPSADKILIICEVLGISPYELLLDTESKNPRGRRTTEFIMIDRNSREYALIEMYEKLDCNAQKRLEGYLQALQDISEETGLSVCGSLRAADR
ncbi:MAG TPA: helix-turn-helix domain-containing protein [Candidatus Mediterraneibacter merdipullorum]|nr:helix-turn-helix domain-containing protein [Candidatus Mediterraneibacter merdipullorum]